ncbi:MAG: acyl-CoA dehydrogenase family protein [Bacteroidetes bacterium]|nr:acyl-CoA dehydrogenase family protein [Bacteroidota bacterium]
MPLKGGAFVTDETNYNDVFLPEDWTEEQLMIRDMVKDFCLQEIHGLGIEKAAALDASKDLDLIVSMLEKSAELGLCGLSIDKEYGGMDLDFNTGLLFGEAISLGFSFATTIGAQTSIGSLPIVFYGTPEQKQKYLPGIASAKLKASYCLTEPGAGSDANSGKTKATLSTDGKTYMLNGQKMWITNGGFADIFIVFAKIEDDKDLSAFIVEKAFGGITLGKEEKKLGIKGSSTVQVFFNNCPVPAENLLSKRGEGFKIALNILNTGRVKLSAGAIGGSKFATTRAVVYANQREQFGKPISSFGAMQYKIGEMVTRTFATESAIYRTGHNIDLKQQELVQQGMDKSEAKLLAVREYAVEAAILKVSGSDVVDYVVDEALQIHGGMGYAVETGIEMGYRDARITRIYEGTNEINRLLSVAELTRRALKTKEVDLMGAGKKLPALFLKQLLPFKSSGGFEEQKRIVKNLKASFLLISGAAGNKLREKMVDEQEIVMNLADILAEAYICESLLLRVQKLNEKKGYDAEALGVQKKLLQLYLHEALDKVRKAGNDAIAAYASGLEKSLMSWLFGLLVPTYNVNAKELRRAVAGYAIRKNAYPFIG